MQLSLENAKTSKVISKIYKTLQLVRLAQTFCALLLAMLPKAVLLPFAIYSSKIYFSPLSHIIPWQKSLSTTVRLSYNHPENSPRNLSG